METSGPARIVIGATSLAGARASMALAVALARRRAATLVGMMADDPGWADIMRAPAVRMLTLAGDPVAPPGAEALQRQARADAKAFETALGRAAAAALLRWRFETIAGPMLPRMRAIAAAGDPVVLGCARMHRHPGAVMLIAPEGGAAARLARDLAADLRADLVVIAVDGVVPTGARAYATRAAALAAIGPCNLSVLIVDPEVGPFRTEGDLAQLLDQARCPVVLARGADEAAS